MNVVRIRDALTVLARALFVWDLPTLVWAGMRYRLAGRRPQDASHHAIFRVLFVPWLAFLAALFVVGVWIWRGWRS